MLVIKQLTVAIDFHSRKKKILWKSMGSHQLSGYYHYLIKISSFVFGRNKLIQVWNNLGE